MIGEKIRNLRLNQGMTLRDLETESGISNVNISRYETGKSKPSVKVLTALAKGLKVSLDDLELSKQNATEDKFDDEVLKTLTKKIMQLPAREKEALADVMDKYIRLWEVTNVTHKLKRD